MGIAHDLWLANRELADASLNCAFVRGIADGSLARDRFSYYVGQDAFFLESFLRAYCIAAAKSPDWQGAQVFHTLATGVLEELELHQSFAHQWGLDLATVRPGRATRQYVDFLLATAWSQPSGITTVAMLPCMKLYAYLGGELARDGIPEHDYSDWIRTYSGEEFAPLVKQLEELADRYGADTAIARDTYRYAMQCELDFFEAAWAEGAKT
ncbi:MAG: TenA family protein [Cyanobacteria bacterium P01_E01_bin.48]